MGLCALQGDVQRLEGRVNELSKATGPLLESMHRTSADQRSGFDERLEKLTAALQPTVDAVNKQNETVSKQNETVSKQNEALGKLSAEIQACRLVAASGIAVLGGVGTFSSAGYSLPGGLINACAAVFVALAVAMGAIVAYESWCFVRSRPWVKAAVAKPDAQEKTVNGSQ